MILMKYLHTQVQQSINHNSPVYGKNISAYQQWKGKKEVVYIHSGILSSHEKGECPAVCDNVHGTWTH